MTKLSGRYQEQLNEALERGWVIICYRRLTTKDHVEFKATTCRRLIPNCLHYKLRHSLRYTPFLGVYDIEGGEWRVLTRDYIDYFYVKS